MYEKVKFLYQIYLDNILFNTASKAEENVAGKKSLVQTRMVYEIIEKL